MSVLTRSLQSKIILIPEFLIKVQRKFLSTIPINKFIGFLFLLCVWVIKKKKNCGQYIVSRFFCSPIWHQSILRVMWQRAEKQSNGKWLSLYLLICHTFSHLIDSKTIIVCPPGFHAASPVRKWVHAPGISPESSEEGGRQENALPRLHHERVVSPLSPLSLILSLLYTLSWQSRQNT